MSHPRSEAIRQQWREILEAFAATPSEVAECLAQGHMLMIEPRAQRYADGSGHYDGEVLVVGDSHGRPVFTAARLLDQPRVSERVRG